MSRCDLSSDIRGGFSRGVPPLPIPNRAVKPARADGTDTPVGRVGRRRASGSPGRLMTSGAPFFVPVPGSAPGPVFPPFPALTGDGTGLKCSPSVRCGAIGRRNGRKCRPSVRIGAVGRRNGTEVFPERAEIHRWATEWGRNVPRVCGAVPLGDGIGLKCRSSVKCGAIGRRNGAEMSPERAARHRWATERGRSVPRACGAVLLGYGTGQMCFRTLV